MSESSRPRVAVLVHDQYQELEFWYPVLRLREQGAEVTVLGTEAERAYESRLGYPVIPDKALGEAAPSDFDALVLPGGGAADRIADEPTMLQFVADAWRNGAVLAATSQSAKVLGRAGVLDGKRVAGADEPVVADGRIVTARSVDDLPGFFRALTGALAPAGK